MTILERINQENVYGVIDVLFTPTFNNIQKDAPKWFIYLVKYWDDKEEIVGELENVGVTIPKWVNTFQMPFEWDESMLDLFFDRLSNQYVCNASIYAQNERFWYEKLRNCGFSQSKALKSQYSETPWQYVLRNSLLKKSKYIGKIVSAIQHSKAHSHCFMNIDKYQELPKSTINSLANGVVQHKKFAKVGLEFIGRNLDKISSAKVLRTYFDTVSHYSLSQIGVDVINEMPISCRIKLLAQLPLDKLIGKLSKISVDDEIKKELILEKFEL